MRVLMLHNRYIQPGGEDVVFESEAALLRENGCDVLTHEEHNANARNLKSLRTAAGTIWSRQSYEKPANVANRRKRRDDQGHRCDYLVFAILILPLSS